jgi:monovalent cation/hydrogen antiporter
VVAVAAAAVVAAVIVIRLDWELALLPLVRFRPGPRPASRQNPVGQRLVIGWAGMRGAISLAVALSLPTMLAGRPFGQRPALIFLAAVVRVVTLIGQGLTLAPLVRVLGWRRASNGSGPRRPRAPRSPRPGSLASTSWPRRGR